jgi:hypothetical protein
MKILRLGQRRGSTLGRARTSLATLALALLGSFTLAGAGGDTLGPPTNNGTGPGNSGPDDAFAGGGGDDETVGTLPTFDGGPTFDLMRNARTARPLLYVQGSADAVLSSALVVRGDHRVFAQAMPSGELRLVFLGDVQVSFDRNGFHAGSLRVGVAIPEGAPILRTNAVWNGQSIANGWWSYVYELPIAQFEANGQLDQAPVFAGVTTPQGSTAVRAHATVDLVTLSQRR